jgi:branched-chain amino acid aminotransferase
MPVQKTAFIWMNGRLVPWDDAKIHVLTHTLHYGLGVFEGIRCYKTPKAPAVFRLLEHMRRLERSAKVYGMKMPYNAPQLCAAAKLVVKENKLQECYIRPIAYYAYGEMGLSPLKSQVHVAIAAWPWGTYLGEEGLKRGVRAAVSSWLRIDSRSLPSSAKACANYTNSILAKLEVLRNGFDEAILLNYHGHVAEGPGENLFAVKDGALVTPPLSAGILEGITRASVIQIACDMSMPVLERDILREELYNADEAFFTGTAAELTPIREIDGRAIGTGLRGPITEKLQKKFFDAVHGKDKKYAGWLNFVK